MQAADLIKTGSAHHPLAKAFKAFLKGKEPTKRQARKFLQSLPNRGAAYKK